MTSQTDLAALTGVKAAATELKLPVVRHSVEAAAEAAQRDQSTYLGFLSELLHTEVDGRRERRFQRRIKEAKFPRFKTLDSFDYSSAPTINPALITSLAAGNYLKTGDPVVLLGDSGTGKSHWKDPGFGTSRY